MHFKEANQLEEKIKNIEIQDVHQIEEANNIQEELDVIVNEYNLKTNQLNSQQ